MPVAHFLLRPFAGVYHELQSQRADHLQQEIGGRDAVSGKAFTAQA